MKIVLFTITMVLMAAGLVIAKTAGPTTESATGIKFTATISKPFEVCTVTTEGGNLNVRASTKNNSRVIAKLPNGTEVNILERGDYISRISVNLKQRLIRGWVSNDFLGGCIE